MLTSFMHQFFFSNLFMVDWERTSINQTQLLISDRIHHHKGMGDNTSTTFFYDKLMQESLVAPYGIT